MPTRAQTFSVRLSDDVKDQVDHIAKITKRSRSVIMTEAVEAYVRARATYDKELDEAVESAESGNGHSFEQISKWMRSWGTEDEIPSPEADTRPGE